MLTEGTKYGIGLHYEDMDYTKMPMVSLISYSAGFATILAAAWSKTSFGITLLRISSGWIKWFIWFIILSVNIILGVSATIMWTRCWPVAKLWYPELEGTCYTPVTMERYQTFTSSGLSNSASQGDLLTTVSILGHHGYCLGHHPVEDCVERRHQQTREIWRPGRHEHGCFVRLHDHLSFPQHPLTDLQLRHHRLHEDHLAEGHFRQQLSVASLLSSKQG